MDVRGGGVGLGIGILSAYLVSSVWCYLTKIRSSLKLIRIPQLFVWLGKGKYLGLGFYDQRSGL